MHFEKPTNAAYEFFLEKFQYTESYIEIQLLSFKNSSTTRYVHIIKISIRHKYVDNIFS